MRVRLSKLETSWSVNTSTYGKLTWDILGFDMDIPSDNSKTHSMTLQMHDCVTSLQFDATAALVYAESEIAAGTYNFSIVAQPWYTADNGKTFQFTLTKAVPIGGQIVLSMTYNQALVGKCKYLRKPNLHDNH